jgi:hypothetical protein
VDRQKFSLVLQNLVSRAIDVSYEKQEVDVFVSIIDVEIPKLATNNSVHRERRLSSIRSTKSNRVAGELANANHAPVGESDYDREVREEEERELEREGHAAAPPSSSSLANQVLRIGVHDRGPFLTEQQKQIFQGTQEKKNLVANSNWSTVEIGLWGESPLPSAPLPHSPVSVA